MFWGFKSNYIFFFGPTNQRSIKYIFQNAEYLTYGSGTANTAPAHPSPILIRFLFVIHNWSYPDLNKQALSRVRLERQTLKLTDFQTDNFLSWKTFSWQTLKLTNFHANNLQNWETNKRSNWHLTHFHAYNLLNWEANKCSHCQLSISMSACIKVISEKSKPRRTLVKTLVVYWFSTLFTVMVWWRVLGFVGSFCFVTGAVIG